VSPRSIRTVFVEFNWLGLTYREISHFSDAEGGLRTRDSHLNRDFDLSHVRGPCSIIFLHASANNIPVTYCPTTRTIERVILRNPEIFRFHPVNHPTSPTAPKNGLAGHFFPCSWKIWIDPVGNFHVISIPAKLQFTVKTRILVIFCGNIPRDQRSSEHLLFSLGRQYSPRFSPRKFSRKPYSLGSEGAQKCCVSVVLFDRMVSRLCTVPSDG
jgi:hypothetical protein